MMPFDRKSHRLHANDTNVMNRTHTHTLGLEGCNLWHPLDWNLQLEAKEAALNICLSHWERVMFIK